MNTLLFSILILIIGYSFDPTLAWLWWSMAILIHLPFFLVFWGMLFGLTYIIFL